MLEKKEWSTEKKKKERAEAGKEEWEYTIKKGGLMLEKKERKYTSKREKKRGLVSEKEEE